jgi:hypothetical protein
VRWISRPRAVAGIPAQSEPEIGDGAGDQREPVVHDSVADNGQHRRRPRRAEADGDGDHRNFDDAKPAGRYGDGVGDVRRPVGHCQRAETRLIPQGEEYQIEREQVEQHVGRGERRAGPGRTARSARTGPARRAGCWSGPPCPDRFRAGSSAPRPPPSARPGRRSRDGSRCRAQQRAPPPPGPARCRRSSGTYGRRAGRPSPGTRCRTARSGRPWTPGWSGVLTFTAVPVADPSGVRWLTKKLARTTSAASRNRTRAPSAASTWR